MEDDFICNVYYTLRGQLKPKYRIRGVNNLFAQGKRCRILQKQAYDARRRLEKRLDVQAQDEDIEQIIDALSGIQQALCYEMYRCGAKFGMRK